MSSKGYSFKVLAPKDIATVLNMIGLHPQVTSDVIDKPTPEIAWSFFQHLSEFAYDMDAQQVKAQYPAVLQSCGQQYVEIFDEAMDVLTIFKMARQLLLINVLDDFSLKDLWDPQSKRFRVLLSAIINFCRYKEGRVTLIASLKEQLQDHEHQRLEQVQLVSEREQELSEAQERNSQELRPMREAEREVQNAQAEVDKLKGQTKCADRVAEEMQAQVNVIKARLHEQEEQKTRLQEQIQLLQSQIADSPEGIEQEIAELQEAVRKERVRLEERSGEKRVGIVRNQVLGQLHEGLDGALQELARLQEAAEAAADAKERAATADDELQRLKQLLEVRCADETDLEQRVKQVASEHERAKEMHEERIKDLEVRRQKALVQHQQLQTKRAEEQRHQHQLQTQRLELEAEVAAARRSHESQVLELSEKQQGIHDQAQAYIRQLDSMLLQLGEQAASQAAGKGKVGRGRSPRCSPERQLAEMQLAGKGRLSRSPSPGRVTTNPLGFLER